MKNGIRITAKTARGVQAIHKDFEDAKKESRKTRMMAKMLFERTIVSENPLIVEVTLTRNYTRRFLSVLGPESLRKPIMNSLTANGATDDDVELTIIGDEE